jgi:hypothetical protein
MRLHRHLSLPYLTNTYLIGPDTQEGGPAIIIDPGAIDVELLRLIENRRYYISAILVTTPKEIYTNGIKTLLKIYNADVYAGELNHSELQVKTVKGGEAFNLKGYSTEIFSAPTIFSREKVMYKIENFIFSGEMISAGMIFNISNTVIRQLFISFLKENFNYLRADTPLFPGSGPPTTIELEKNLIEKFIEDSERPNFPSVR